MEFENINTEESSIPVVKIPVSNSLEDLPVTEIPQKVTPEPICNACTEKDIDLASLYPDLG